MFQKAIFQAEAWRHPEVLSLSIGARALWYSAWLYVADTFGDTWKKLVLTSDLIGLICPGATFENAEDLVAAELFEHAKNDEGVVLGWSLSSTSHVYLREEEW